MNVLEKYYNYTGMYAKGFLESGKERWSRDVLWLHMTI